MTHHREMLICILSSRTLKHGLTTSIKTTPLLSTVFTRFSTRNHTELRHDRPSDLFYRSVITQVREDQDFLSIHRGDYTLNQDVAKANHAITRLCKEGKISEARQLFDEMPERDVISWTALISGCVKCGLIGDARELFDRDDAVKNVVTWTAMMSGYLKTARLSEAENLFDEMPDKNIVAWNTMIDGYMRCGSLERASELFDRMGERNVVSWNTVISGLVNRGCTDEARKMFDRMPTRNVISWTIMVSGLAKNGKVDDARLLFDRMPERNVVSWNAMINGYTQNTRLCEAYGLFEKMPEKGVQSWNTMITGFIQNGELEMGRKLFNEMPVKKNVVSWTAIISGCVQSGQNEEGLRTFYLMVRDERVKPNELTFVSVFGACSNLAGLSEGTQVHQVISKTVYQESRFVISAVINMYSKCGELEMAKRAFDDGLRGHRDLVSWNSMIAAYAHHGCGREAIAVFEEMWSSGLEPNDVTYVGLLSACSHAGLVEEGLNYFNALLRDGTVKVRDDHYTCVVDLFGRAGRLKEAFDLVGQFPMKASGYAWGALLQGCSVHGDDDLGKLVAERLLKVEPGNTNGYLLLRNSYIASGEWKEAEMVKAKMKGEGLKKQPGCSWIEVGNRIRVFVVGNCSQGELGLLLLDLHEEMRKVGMEDVMEQSFL